MNTVDPGTLGEAGAVGADRGERQPAVRLELADDGADRVGVGDQRPARGLLERRAPVDRERTSAGDDGLEAQVRPGGHRRPGRPRRCVPTGWGC